MFPQSTTTNPLGPGDESVSAVPRPSLLRQQAVGRGVEKRARVAADAVESIVAAAYRLLERDQALDISIRELVAEAGVSNRVFYRHFPAKEHLIATLVDEVYSTLIVTQAELIASTKGAESQLEAWVDGALRYATEPDVAARGRVFVAHAARLRVDHGDLFRTSGRALIDQVTSIIELGRVDGTLFSQDSPSSTLTRNAQPSTSAANTPKTEPRMLARMIVRLVLATLQEHVLVRTVPTPGERDYLVNFVKGSLS